MKKIAIALLLTAAACAAQDQDGFHPASTNVWGAPYPRVDAGGRAQFRVKAPAATRTRRDGSGKAMQTSSSTT